MKLLRTAFLLGSLVATTFAQRAEGQEDDKYPDRDLLETCPGYKASNVKTIGSGLTADLTLAGEDCNAYGDDVENLTLEVTYESGEFVFMSRELRL